MFVHRSIIFTIARGSGRAGAARRLRPTGQTTEHPVGKQRSFCAMRQFIISSVPLNAAFSVCVCVRLNAYIGLKSFSRGLLVLKASEAFSDIFV